MADDRTQEFPAVVPDQDDEQTFEPQNGHDAGKAPGTVFEALQAKRLERAEKKTLDVPIPGWFGCLGLRLGPIPSRQLDRIVDVASSSKAPEKNFNANADIVIQACVAVVGRLDRDDPWEEQLDPDGVPYRVDVRLKDRMKGLQAETARGLLRELFSAAPSPELAIDALAGEYARWASAANEELDEELLGES